MDFVIQKQTALSNQIEINTYTLYSAIKVWLGCWGIFVLGFIF